MKKEKNTGRGCLQDYKKSGSFEAVYYTDLISLYLNLYLCTYACRIVCQTVCMRTDDNDY